MSKRYSDRVHLLNPLPFVLFLHFCQWRRKAHSLLTNTAFFSNCSGLLRCIKQGSRQFTTIFWLVVVNMSAQAALSKITLKTWICKWLGVWIGPDCRTKSKQFFTFIYSGNCQNTEISVCTFQFHESPYKYGRTFTHVYFSLLSVWNPLLKRAPNAAPKSTLLKAEAYEWNQASSPLDMPLLAMVWAEDPSNMGHRFAPSSSPHPSCYTGYSFVLSASPCLGCYAGYSFGLSSSTHPTCYIGYNFAPSSSTDHACYTGYCFESASSPSPSVTVGIAPCHLLKKNFLHITIGHTSITVSCQKSSRPHYC